MDVLVKAGADVNEPNTEVLSSAIVTGEYSSSTFCCAQDQVQKGKLQPFKCAIGV